MCREDDRTWILSRLKKMPIASRTHQFDEITYKVEGLKVKSITDVPFKEDSKKNRSIFARR